MKKGIDLYSFVDSHCNLSIGDVLVNAETHAEKEALEAIFKRIARADIHWPTRDNLARTLLNIYDKKYASKVVRAYMSNKVKKLTIY